MTYENWLEIMQAYGFDQNSAVCGQLIKAHGARGRHYHTAEHISACLRHLDNIRDQVSDWKSMALAFWFHDAVYNPFKSDNERKSANWAMEFLQSNGASPDQIKRVEKLIMATCHNAEGLEGDMQLLVDIDLAILGAKPDVYDAYEINIRKEYKRVPGFIFRPKRKALLQSFLDRPRIYGSNYFHEKWEARARDNLARSISN